jgi:hypothetical protein
MLDRSMKTFDWRRRLAIQFPARRIARYHLGIEILRGWQWLDAHSRKVWLKLEGRRRMRSMVERLERCRGLRMNRVSGGIEVLVFTGCFVALVMFRMSIRDTVATAPAKMLPMKAPVMPPPLVVQVLPPTVTTAPAENSRANSAPAAALAMGAPLADAPQPTVDPASKLKLDYAYARERCLARLRETEQYQRAKRSVDELEAQVQALRQDDPREQLPAISVKWITAKSELNSLTQTALRDDPDVRATESVLRAAGFIQPVFPMRANASDLETAHPEAAPGATAATE